jgi:hypothetical protein
MFDRRIREVENFLNSQLNYLTISNEMIFRKVLLLNEISYNFKSTSNKEELAEALSFDCKNIRDTKRAMLYYRLGRCAKF